MAYLWCCLEHLAAQLGGVAGCAYGRLLVGPQEEDRRRQATGHAHLGGRQDLRRGRLDRQALRRRGPRGEAAREGHEGAPGCHPPPEARVPASGLRAQGQRLDGLSDAQAPGMEPKKRSVGASERDGFLRAAWRTLVAAQIDASRLVFVEECSTNTSLRPLYAWSRRGERAFCSAPRNWGKNVTLLSSLSAEGMCPSVAVEGATTRVVFEAYLEEALCPSLSPGQVVVMDNLSAHKGQKVRELIEESGCELLYLPPYSPDYNP